MSTSKPLSTPIRLLPPAGWLVAASLAAMLLPTVWRLYGGVWQHEQQGHGPLVLAVVCWLFWQKRGELLALEARPAPRSGWSLLILALFGYVLGRSQGILLFEVGGFPVLLAALLLLFLGAQALRCVWFALFFMLFLIPLPLAVVDALTGPMKLAVSVVVEWLLQLFGYPVARSGVILQVGPYQLLVADACAGLQTLFTLEAMGLLYLNLVRTASWSRNVVLAVLIVPISFMANVLRVLILVLITYYFGDAAGQGFLHGFSGIVLFMLALVMIIATDALLRLPARSPS